MICQKTISLTVEEGLEPIGYWNLDAGAPGGNTDQVTGDAIQLLTFGAPGDVSSAPAGKISNCVRWTNDGGAPAVGITYAESLSYSYTGNGFALAFWLFTANQGGFSDDYVFSYRWDISGADTYGFFWQNDVVTLNAGGATPLVTPLARPADGAWHFIAFSMTASGDLSVSVDGAALSLLGNGGVAPAQPGELAQLAFNMSTDAPAGGEFWQMDELSLFATQLNQAQVDFLWNGGNARSYPF